MKEEKYFILTSSEDGIGISMVSKDELEKTLKEHAKEYGKNPEFLNRIPDIDKGCWEQGDDEYKMLIIKGQIIVPKPVKRVTEYEVE